MPRAIPAFVLALLFSIPSFAGTASDHVQIGRRIVIGPGEKAGDVVCILCPIVIRGEAEGDTVAILGSITLEGAQTSGDVVAIAGGVRLASGVHVGGDLVTIGGGLHRDPDSTVGGEVTSVGGPGLAMLVVFVPLALLAGFIALIVWLIQRSRQPQAPAYPGGAPNVR